MTDRNTPSRRRSRPGMAVVIIVVILALISLVMIAAVGGGQADAQASALRVETMRAFYAAESGSVIVFKSVVDGDTLPAEGSQVTLGAETVEFIAVPPSGVGEVTVEGRSGFARRRVSIDIE
ncbi:MAG: pilus assembly PilX N-terminal domain-containing protein [Phycisphaerales bacterium]